MSYPLRPISAEVLDFQVLAPDHFELRLLAPAVVQNASPGQFVQVKVGATLDPLLRRPLSLSSWQVKSGELRLWIQRVGRGTAGLAELRAGQSLDLLGPLGRGFPPVSANEELLLVAGGIGIAPLMQLVAVATAHGCRVTVCLGARCADYLLGVEQLRAWGAQVLLATDDGSAGHHGLVTDVLGARLEQGVSRVMACGPWPMLCAVRRQVAGWDYPLYLSLEQHMACGTGACQGCAVKAGDRPGYYRVCVDGPVFSASQLQWPDQGGGGHD